VRVGDEVELEVTAIGLDGAGRGFAGERELRVPGAFAGETVRVRIEHLSRQHPRGAARRLKVLTAHPGRRKPPCPNQGPCGGCDLMPLEVVAQRAQKKAMLARLGLAVAEVEAAGPARGYRYSSKRIVAGMRGGVVLGSRRRGSGEVASMRGCLVDHPKISAAADHVADVMSARAVRPESVKAVWLKTDGERVLVTIVAEERPPFAEALEVEGVAWSRAGDGNSLRGEAAEVLCGVGSLSVGGVAIGPLGFLQPNPAVAEAMMDALLEGVTERRAFELYAGSGAITRRLSGRGVEVAPCEAYPESAAALGVAPMRAEEFLAAASEAPPLVVANPPRKGLGGKVCAELNRLGAPALRLLCCGPEALVRDLARLDYEVESLRAFDTLPQTPHVEVVAVLRRRRGLSG